MIRRSVGLAVAKAVLRACGHSQDEIAAALASPATSSIEWDWSKCKDGVMEQVLRSGDTFLDAQLKLATSADQRASVMASVFAASGAAIAGGTMAVLVSQLSEKGPIVLGGLITAGLFIF